MKQPKSIIAWAITDWGGGIKHPSISIFDTKNEAKRELARFDRLPDPKINGERNKIIKIKITPIE